jgi:hypothetical protein
MTADNFVNISGGNVQGFIYENNGNVTLNGTALKSGGISPEDSFTQ